MLESTLEGRLKREVGKLGGRALKFVRHPEWPGYQTELYSFQEALSSLLR
jgi:hypothetical protein